MHSRIRGTGDLHAAIQIYPVGVPVACRFFSVVLMSESFKPALISLVQQNILEP